MCFSASVAECECYLVRVLLNARARLSASVPECDCGRMRVVLSASGAECAVLEYILQNGWISLLKEEKLSVQGSQATLSEAKVSHVQAKRKDGSIF